MYNRVQLFRGLIHPYIHSYQLKKAEHVTSIWLRTLLLILTSAILFGISAYYGIGNEILSKKIYNLTPEKFEALKGLFGAGQILWGMFWAAFIIFFPALLFWIYTDVDYQKLVVVQLYVLVILLIEKAVSIPFHIAMRLDETSMPYSFGVIGQAITSIEFFIYLLASITIFKIWGMVVQYKYLKALSEEKSSKQLVFFIIAINLLFWVFSALISTVGFEKLI